MTPDPQSIQTDSIPAELRIRPQWVLWRTVTRGGSPTKIPFSPTGKAKTNDPSTWSSFDEIVRSYSRTNSDGIGFVFSQTDPFFGIDLDGCRDPVTGAVEPWAREIVIRFSSYAEVSPSKTGVKIFASGKTPFESGKKIQLPDEKDQGGKKPGIEVYSAKRYFAVTGWRLAGTPEIRDCTDAVQWLADRYFQPTVTTPTSSSSHSSLAVIERARKYLLKLPPAVSGEGGHNATYAAATALVHGFALSQDRALRILTTEYNPRCKPPWSESELRHKVKDAAEKPHDKPRGYLLNGADRKRPAVNARTQPIETGDAEEASNGISNAIITTDEEGHRHTIPKPMQEILHDIRHATDGWPRRIGDALFVHEGDTVSWLRNASAFVGWLGTRTGSPPRFHKATGCHTPSEVFCELQRTAKSYAAVETMPHEPPFLDHYYTHAPIPPGDGQFLREFIDRFTPETSIDRDLILAMFVTAFWGGPAGTRPAFVITADSGRGAGKSRLAAMLTHLAGGAIEVSAVEDFKTVKERLLSPDGLTKRIAILDNVKSLRFSWAELEATITTPTISGRKLYVGEGQRPNTLLWIFTLNGAALSTDMAQRSVIIKLRKPAYSATWEEDTRRYIDTHRQQIIGDIIGFLRTKPARLERYSRWGAWERDVLARLPEPSDAQDVIRERQEVADVEAEESTIIEDFFGQQLSMVSYNTETDRVFIPSAVAARWLGWALNDKLTVSSASRILRQKINEGKLRNLQVCASRSLGRGFVWAGENCDVQTSLNGDLETRIRARERFK